NVLKSGKLPAPAHITQEAIIGPSLGQNSIDSGLRSFVIALLLVLLYMIFYYSGAGLVSNVALIANVFFIFGVLSSLGAVLTLPGIAGIVLTIGMSVDANVLIYERIREELANGKGIRLAISDGYNSAYSSIIDANVTTLLTGIILFSFGTGPIKGFATTLIIGIITSLFSAIFITRLIISYRLNKGKEISFSTKLTKGAFKNINIDFIGKRKIFYVISSLIILFGGYSLSTKGLDYGIDFKGGRTYVVSFADEVSKDNVKEILTTSFDGMAPSVNEFNLKGQSGDQLKITTKYRIDENNFEADTDVKAKLFSGLDNLNIKYTIESQEKVGPTIADDIRDAALWSVIFSLIVIFLYILIRFKKWQFSLGAVVAVFHDVILVLSVFSIFYGVLPFSLEIDQAFIAAILTIIGYSLNDTVVVFDRVRENMFDSKKEVYEIINKSLNSTLSRTINTSLTTFVVLFVIFWFGGESIKGFMFALMVGVVVGTYSSLFVASPIMLDTIKRKELKIK
ncbi:MAG: protein translocase subunit SecF, partial [Flavobacteriales bacterium]